jgi:simple sugar transport system ATP-binding protein
MRGGKVVADNINPKCSSVAEVEQVITGMSEEDVSAAVA